MVDERKSDFLKGEISMGDIVMNEPMNNHTTLRIGGPADVFAVPKDQHSLKNLVSALEADHVPSMPLGGGSNLLVSDGGIEGAVISISLINKIQVMQEDENSALLLVEAGAPLGGLVKFAGEKGYKGLEGLTGIPGSLGGAIRGNAGSFGCEIGDVVESLTVMDRSGKTSLIKKEDIGFAYRSSGISDTVIVLSALMRFQRDEAQQVTKRMIDFHREKMARQPIARFSAGCVFKNPAGAHAGMLIDKSGCKGMRKGDIEVSSLHANFFVNTGNGSARDFLALMEEVRERVMKSFGAELVPEIRIVGRF